MPLHFSPPHPDAVGSRGDEFARWAEERSGLRLRWWQWIAAQRRYEVRADGSWCWMRVFESVPRQQGKSVSLGEDAAWIGSLPRDDPVWSGAFDRSGAKGMILHAADTVYLAKETQSELWSWAVDAGLVVAKGTGDSRITWPHGTTWKTTSLASTYGYHPRRLLVDESWSVDPVRFYNAMWPALGAQRNPQALFWSAANPSASLFVPGLRSDPAVCRMEWGAHPSEDPGDPAVWRAASAYWDRFREGVVSAAHGAPGFAEEWLNQWPVPADAQRWLPAAVTGDAAKPPVARNPPQSAVCAVECSLDGSRWALAACWESRGLLRARVWDMPDLDACLRVAGSRVLRMHEAVFQRLPLRARFTVEPVNVAQHRAATGVLADALRRGRVAVAGVDDEVWARVRVTPADGGEVVDARRSTGDVHGVKALAWCVWAVESEQGRSGLVL